MKIIKPSVKLRWITPFAEESIEEAARLCYKSEDKICEGSAEKMINRLLNAEPDPHKAMIEHGVASMHFITDRGVTHELVRHRLASYAQESTRYCNYSLDKFEKAISIIQPPCLTELGKQAWIRAVISAEQEYFNMLESGETPQIARSVLPNCLKTEIIITTNFTEWLHIFKLRRSVKAHPQIKEVMDIAFQILHEKCPTVFKY